MLRGFHDGEVSRPGVECFVASIVRRSGRSRWAGAVVAVEKHPPDVNPETSEDWPLDDVKPAECVSGKCPDELDGKRRDGERESRDKGDMETDCVCSLESLRR